MQENLCGICNVSTVLRRVVSKCYGVEANKDAKRTKMLLESKMNANELKRHQVSGSGEQKPSGYAKGQSGVNMV